MIFCRNLFQRRFLRIHPRIVSKSPQTKNSMLEFVNKDRKKIPEGIEEY